MVGLIYYCIGYTGYISTLNWDGVSPTQQHVGFANYTQLFHDPVFWDAIRHTVYFFVVTFSVQTAVGFTFAALLHSKIKLANLYKVIIFIPVVLAPATMAPIFRQVFSATGQFNTVLQDLGLGSLAHPWLAQSSTALPVIMAITVWEWTGVTFILYFAAMTQIDKEILEAARIDGAGEFRTFFVISSRLLAPGIVTVVLFTVVATWNNYFLPLIMLSTPNWYPLTVGLNTWNMQAATAGGQTVYNLVITGSLLTVIPIMAAFLYLQRYWRSGLATGSVKG